MPCRLSVRCLDPHTGKKPGFDRVRTWAVQLYIGPESPIVEIHRGSDALSIDHHRDNEQFRVIDEGIETTRTNDDCRCTEWCINNFAVCRGIQLNRNHGYRPLGLAGRNEENY
jgi:hypothetical protein